MIQLDWRHDLKFSATTPSNHRIEFDTVPSEEGPSSGPTPMEMLLASAAACSAMDVVSILQKKRQEVTAYRIEIDGLRSEPGVWPRPFLSIHIRHFVSGVDLDPAAVARAVELSDEKYCSVVSTLRSHPEVTSTFTIE